MTSRVPGLDAARPILDALAQPVVVTDLEATILYWNKAAADLYGFSSDEALGQCLYALIQSPPSVFGNESMDPLHQGRPLVDPSAQRPFPLREGADCADDDDVSGSRRTGTQLH